MKRTKTMKKHDTLMLQTKPKTNILVIETDELDRIIKVDAVFSYKENKLLVMIKKSLDDLKRHHKLCKR